MTEARLAATVRAKEDAMPTLQYLRDTVADDTKGPHAALNVLVEYLQHVEDRLARIEAMVTRLARYEHPDPVGGAPQA